MRYRLSFKSANKDYCYQLEHGPIDKSHDTFSLTIGNIPFVCSTRHPLLGKKGFKHKNYELKQSGEGMYARAVYWKGLFCGKWILMSNRGLPADPTVPEVLLPLTNYEIAPSYVP